MRMREFVHTYRPADAIGNLAARRPEAFETGIPEGLARPADCPNGPVCGIVALAIAARISFSEAKRVYQSVFNRPGQWRGRSSQSERETVLEALGVQFRPIRVRKPEGEKGIRYSLVKWAEIAARRDVLYMVCIRGHVFMFKNGRVTDQRYQGTPVSAVRFKRCRVRYAIEILR